MILKYGTSSTLPPCLSPNNAVLLLSASQLVPVFHTHRTAVKFSRTATRQWPLHHLPAWGCQPLPAGALWTWTQMSAD